MDIASLEPSGSGAHPARYLAATLAAIVGTLVSMIAFLAVSHWELQLDELKLLDLAKTHQQTLNSDLQYATDVLYTLRANYSAADHTVSRSEFQSFARELRSRHVGLRNTGWARRVTREERDAFERAVRAEGFPDFEIWERDSQGNRVRAGDRAEYLPILYPDPVEYTAQILGFDILSEPVRAEALRRAGSSERPAATPPMNLITPAEPDGFMTFIPVYAKGTRESVTSRVPEGFMYGVFATGPMIENILGAKEIPFGLDIYFFNPNGNAGNRRIYWHPSPTTPASAAVPSEYDLLARPHWTDRIRVADQEWGAIFAPPATLLADSWSWQAIAVLAAGLAMTGLIVTYLVISLKRTMHLEFLTASLRRATSDVMQLARSDSMTGLANRAMFTEHLNQAVAAAKRDGTCFAVIYADLDHFKDVNDTLGHPSGDLLLQITADRLRAIVGKSDLIARLGGDEFAIWVADASDPAAVARLATRINDALMQQYDLDGNTVRVSASLGVSLFDPAASPEDLMRQADVALYQAKGAGRNNFCFHSTALDHAIRERVAMTEDLNAALLNNELELFYQPQVEVPSGRIIGLEALVRWNHPVRGLLLPGSFIPIAEKSGTIHMLGRWVLHEACRQSKRWQADGISPPVIAINISASQFRAGSPLDQQLQEALARYAVDPCCIEIELTESALIELTDANSNVIRRVGELGVRIAIDDFGTGYSSLEHLRACRVNRLKIARKFMPDVAIKSGDAAIVRTSLMLARELGMEAIAEGVETAEQLAFLLSTGCRYVQGYYYSRPVPALEASALLRNGTIARTPSASLPAEARAIG